jgi:hypothetical protein
MVTPVIAARAVAVNKRRESTKEPNKHLVFIPPLREVKISLSS